MFLSFWAGIRVNVIDWKPWGALILSSTILFVLFFWYHSLSLQDLYCVRSDLGNLLKALGRLDEAKVRTYLCYSLLSPWPYELCRFVKIMIMKTIPVFPNMLSLLESIFERVPNTFSFTVQTLTCSQHTSSVRVQHVTCPNMHCFS